MKNMLTPRSPMSHSQALMVVGSPHEEHRTIMDAKVNDL